MAGTCVEKLPHSCGTTDALQVFEEDGKFSGYCFRCNTYVADPYEDKPKNYTPMSTKKTPEQIAEELKEIEECPVVALPDRKIKDWSLEHFEVKIGLSEEDGKTPTLHYYPYTKNNTEVVGYKVRLINPKRMWSVGDLKEVDLFGWKQAIRTGSKKLFIVEGELDAISLYQIIMDHNRNTKYAAYTPAVVSIPHGAATAVRDLTRLWDVITSKFKEVIYIPDQDEAGLAAKEALSRSLPQLMFADLPLKDVNECLMANRSVAAYNTIVFNASKPKNTRIITGSSLSEAAKKRPEMGISWPWEGMTKATRGIRRGETYYIGAGAKMGKSEIVNAIAAHLIEHHGLPVLLVKPEEPVQKTYQRLVGKIAGRIFHDPNIPFDEKAFDEADALVGDKALIVDLYQFVDWETLKNDIRYSVEVLGVKDVFLDPITCFTNQMSVSAGNEFLVKMSAELSAMAKDMDFTAYIFCHLKAPDFGPPHERGGKVLSAQFAGSRAMMRSCNMMIGLEGDKDPDKPIEERNQRTLVLLEDREFGNTARVRLYWDENTGKLKEI